MLLVVLNKELYAVSNVVVVLNVVVVDLLVLNVVVVLLLVKKVVVVV